MRLADWQKRAHDVIRSGAPAEGVFLDEKNLRAYTLAFPATVVRSLEDDFPLLLRLLGNRAFRERVTAWLEEPRGYFVEIRALAPAFLAFLEARGEPPPVLRAARLDLLAEQARIAPEPSGTGGLAFGLHPSARLLSEGHRRYCLWRQDGEVCRERLSADELRLLECFREPAELAVISERLERSGLGTDFVQEAVAVWSASGVVGAFEVREIVR